MDGEPRQPLSRRDLLKRGVKRVAIAAGALTAAGIQVNLLDCKELPLDI